MSNGEENGADAPAEEQPEEESPEPAPSTTVERVGPYECVIRIEADADYLRDRYREELASLQTEAKLPGFRRGRAPVGLVERRMGRTLRSDLIASVVAEAYDDAVEEQGLTVVAETDAPDLEDFTWEPGQPAEFEFKCEVLPEVAPEEKDYKGLEVDAPALEATDELLQTEMDRFAQQFATWEEVTGPGIDWDDYVEAEVSVPEANWSETIGFYPRAETIGPFAAEGIKAALTGAEVGDEIELEAEAIEDQVSGREQLAGLAGQKVKLHLALRQATRRRVPDVDEELAGKLGLSSVDEIRDMVRERLEKALAQRKDEVVREMLVRRVLENVPCEMPPSLVERAAQEDQVRALVRLLRMGVPRQEAERAAAERAEQTREAVERRLKATYLLRKIAEIERVVVTESEVDSQIRAFASRQGWREERARSYMEERGMVRAFRDDMRESKTLDLLVENAQVNEVSPEEFAKRHGGEREPEAAEGDPGQEQ